MNTPATLGPLTLDLTLLQQPVPQRHAKAMLGVKATVCSPFSEISVENLCLEFQDFLAFRKRLRKFTERQDTAAGWHTLMPMFDLSLTCSYEELVRAEVRISPNIRGERHIYDFDTSLAEVARFAHALDVRLLSATLEA